jgi:hypothetical protein
MQNSKSTDTERNMAIEKVIEDIPGGGVITVDDLPTTVTSIGAGVLAGEGSDGKWHVSKTAMLVGALPASGFTAFQVYNNHTFKAADLISPASGIGASGVRITSIAASGAGKDVITVGSTFSVAIAASGILIESATSGFPNTNTFRYPPTAITTNAVETAASGNNGAGLLVRGTVRQGELPYCVDASIKALLPLIRFV